LASLASCNQQDRGRVEASVRLVEPECQLPALLLSEIPGAKTIAHRFEIENRSEAPQQVRFQGRSCNCLGLSLPDEARELKTGDTFALGANERKALQLALQVAARSETQAHTAHFVAVGPGSEEVPLDLRVVVPVLADVTIVPPVVYHEFASSAPATVEKKLLIRRTGRGQVPVPALPQFIDLPPQVELLAVTPTDSEQPYPELWTQGWKALLVVNTRPSLESTFAGSFLISLSKSPPSTTRIPVTLRRCSGVEVNPTSLDFGAVPRGEPCRRKFRLASADEKSFRIVKVESDAASFTPSIEKFASALHHWIDVTFDAREVGEHRARIVIETTHPDSPRLTVQVRATCR
jgi:hypothetical protein